ILRHRYSVHYTLSLHDALPIWVKYDQLRRLRLEQGCENGADDNSACRYCSQREHGGYENLGDKTHAASAVVAMVANNGRGVSHRSEEHTSELQSRFELVCRLLL